MYSPSPYSIHTVDNFKKSSRIQMTQSKGIQDKRTSPITTNMTNYTCVKNVLDDFSKDMLLTIVNTFAMFETSAKSKVL